MEDKALQEKEEKKFAEKLILLDDVARGLKVRMHQMKKRFANQQARPAFLNDPGLKRILEAFIKSFPTEPLNLEKTPGYDILSARNKDILGELEPYYSLLTEVCDFKDHAYHLLNDLSSKANVVDLKWDSNPALTAGFMNLVVNFIKIHLLLGSLEERRIIVSLYARCHFTQNQMQEANVARLRLFVAEYDQTFKTIQNELSSVQSCVGDTLQSISNTYAKIRDLSVLRREGVLNITQNHTTIQYAVNDPVYFELMYSSAFQEWIVYGLLFCPNELSSPVLCDLLKSVLQDSWVTTIFRDETFMPHVEFENLFSWFKGSNVQVSKVRKIISETTILSAAKAGQVHKEWRTVLKQEVSNLFKILGDKPGLIAPKLLVVLANLHLSVTEIRWYFAHTDKQPPKKSKFREEDYVDISVSELIYYTTRLHSLLSTHQSMIKKYYGEYLKGPDLKSIEQIVSDLNAQNKLTERTKAYLEAVVSDVHSFDQNAAKIDFGALRLNWLRCESALSLVGLSHTIHTMRDLSYRMNLIIFHTKFVDRLTEVADEHGSMRSLWWHHEPLFKMFQDIVQSPTLAHTWPGFLYLCNQFSENAHRMLPAERPVLGKTALDMAQKIATTVANTACALVVRMHPMFHDLFLQTHPTKAAVPVQKKDKKKAAEPTNVNGTESIWSRRGEVSQLDLYVSVVSQLAQGMAETQDGVVVYAAKVYPAEFLVEKIQVLLRLRVKQIYKPEENALERPSLIMAQISTLFQSLRPITDNLDVDVPHLLHDIMFENVVQTSTDANLLIYARGWYVTYIKKLVSTKGVTYSPLNKLFIADNMAGIKPAPEDYLDCEELKALALLVGPVGMKVIQLELLKQSHDQIETIKKILIANQHVLSELRSAYLKEDTCNECIKKLKNLDDLVTASIQLGLQFQARKLMQEATAEVMASKVPLLFNCVQVAESMYPPNTYAFADFSDIDMLALDYGINTGAADPVLTKLFSHFNASTSKVDMTVWDLLPFAYAACFTCSVWKDTVFVPATEGFNNNMQCMSLAISTLMVGMQSISARIPLDPEIQRQLQANDRLIKETLTRFLDVSSIIILRLPQQKNMKDYNMHSLFIFLDKFIDLTPPFVLRDALETRLPYSLIRNAYSAVYRQDQIETERKKAIGLAEADAPTKPGKDDKKDNS